MCLLFEMSESGESVSNTKILLCQTKCERKSYFASNNHFYAIYGVWCDLRSVLNSFLGIICTYVFVTSSCNRFKICNTKHINGNDG